MTGWERSLCGTYETITAKGDVGQGLIATVRCAKSKQTIATATLSAVTLHVPSTKAIKDGVALALVPYHTALKGAN